MLYSSRLRQFVCAASILLAGLPALRADFLFSDDYYWFDIQHSRPEAAAWEATMMTVMNGRPLHGLLFIASFPAVATPAAWIALRVLGLLLLAFTGWSLARTLRRVWEPREADWIATALAVLPGFVLFSFWLIAMPCLLAAACGVFALELELDAERRAWRRHAAAAGLLMLGLFNYQPFALIYFSLLGLFALLGRFSPRAFWFGVVVTGVYFVLARLLIAAFGFDIAARGELSFQPLEKLRWLFGSALPFASKLWSIALPSAVGLAVLLATAAVSVLRARLAWRELARRSFWFLACAALCVLPHLSVRETVSRWRTLLPLSLLFALAWFAALGLRRWPKPALPALVLGLLALHAFELQRYGVLPERALVLQAQQQLRAAGPEVFVLRATERDAACGPRLSDDEYTAPSSQRDYAVSGLVRLASELEGLPMPEVTQGDDLERAAAPSIDLRHVQAQVCARAMRRVRGPS
ncbi:MAG TPA: hypothetical protein VJR89_23015 [Polyangiales bacterium]|nr:hypothetical protein [Polyangiales bacterium]